MIWAWGQTDQITDQDIWNYWASLSEAKRIDVVRDYIITHNEDPAISDPGWYWVLKDQDITVFHSNDIIMDIGSLSYNLDIAPIVLTDVIPESRIPIIEICAGIVGGLIVGYLLNEVIK